MSTKHEERAVRRKLMKRRQKINEKRREKRKAENMIKNESKTTDFGDVFAPSDLSMKDEDRGVKFSFVYSTDNKNPVPSDDGAGRLAPIKVHDGQYAGSLLDLLASAAAAVAAGTDAELVTT